jgi:hypothetical protein
VACCNLSHPVKVVAKKMQTRKTNSICFICRILLVAMILCYFGYIALSAPFPVPIKTNRVYTIADYVVVTAT